MNLRWTIRIVLGPMRPFLLRKVRDRLREFRLVRRTRKAVPTRPSEGRTLRSNIVPLPSAAWFAEHGKDVLTFARRMRSGVVGAYGIDTWSVGDDDPQGVDVRCVHELSRMHHWCAYALAAHIDAGDRDQWCELLEHEILRFVRSYPVGRGVHWKFPMGTGIRLHAMLVAWDWARRSGWQSIDGDRMVAATAIDHALMTYAERESRGGLSTSHYAANLLGVLAASIYIEGYPDCVQWSNDSRRELLSEIERQILSDGMANEASTGYHRQVIDTFVLASQLIMCGDHSFKLSPSHRTLLISALARCRQLESMGMPLVGDNDDGLSMKLIGFAPDMSYTYDVAERLFGAAALVRSASDMAEFGLAILSGNGLQITLRNGPVGQFGKGGHAHNDQNSITVRVDDNWFVVDPGSSTYTLNSMQRNAERSAAAHSTMWAASAEQGECPQGDAGLFWLLDDRIERKLTRASDGGLRGEIMRSDVGRHVRELSLENGALHGHDVFTGTAEHSAESVFVFHPDVLVEHASEGRITLTSGQTKLVFCWTGAEGQTDLATYSERYATKCSTLRLRLRGSDISWSMRREAP